MKSKTFHSILTILILSSLSYSCKKSDGQETVSNNMELLSSNQIFGNDDRIATKNGNLEKNIKNKIGTIRTIEKKNDNTNNVRSCSGAVIGKNLVLTAAHCLFSDSRKGTLIKDAYFYPGAMDDNTYPFGRFPIIKSYQPVEYRAQDLVEDENDIAIVELGPNSEGKHISQLVGTLAYWGKKQMDEDMAMTAGYPGDKEAMTQYYEKDCEVEPHINERKFSIYCDVIEGQSGSPVLSYSEEHGFHYIWGVVTSSGFYQNSGSRITPERQRIINAIKKSSFKSENYEEKWKTNKHTQSNEINLFIQNECNRDIHIASYYKTMENEWRAVGLYSVKKDKTIHLGKTGNGVFYFAATTDRGRSFTNRKDIVKDLEGGRGSNVPLEKVSVNKYGDYFKVFDCR